MRPAGGTGTIGAVHDETEPALIYRTEVLAIIGALADIVVGIREVGSILEGRVEEEEE